MKTQKLYLALTRPPQKLEISHELFVLVITITMILFIRTHRFLVIICLVPLYFLAKYINSKDSQLLGVRFKKLQNVTMIKNKKFWDGCNSYDPLGKTEE